jgi:hypothetical protein
MLHSLLLSYLSFLLMKEWFHETLKAFYIHRMQLALYPPPPLARLNSFIFVFAFLCYCKAVYFRRDVGESLLALNRIYTVTTVKVYDIKIEEARRILLDPKENYF